MLSSVLSCGLTGIDGFEVIVEMNLANGMPMFDVVGLPDAAVKESRERVRAAVKNAGFEFPAARLTANLAPADLKKEGPAFDLPLALGILCCMGVFPAQALEGMCVFGELSLDGSLRPVRGALPMVISAVERGVKEILLPAANLNEVRCIEGARLYPAENLTAAVRHLTGQLPITPPEPVPYASIVEHREYAADFRHVKGQTSAKRALEIAAAGGHNVLLIGPPGSGKTLMARCMPTILPDMTFAEALETTRIHSVAGCVPPSGLLAERPFRSPHHTASHASLVGGGNNALPGEISKAHNGVLFLDELPEFHRDVLEAMRQPLEDGTVTVARSGGTLHLPARFQLVCAMNPCRCGWRGHPSGRCTCSDREVAKYVEKISGPLLDRIDLHVSVPAVEYASMRRKETPESSADVKCRVDAARAVQTARFAGTGVTCNAHMTAPMIGQFCCLDHAGDALMKSAFERMGLTARSHDRILRVARTIADLDGAADIRPEHLAEAIQFRNTDILKG